MHSKVRQGSGVTTVVGHGGSASHGALVVANHDLEGAVRARDTGEEEALEAKLAGALANVDAANAQSGKAVDNAGEVAGEAGCGAKGRHERAKQAGLAVAVGDTHLYSPAAHHQRVWRGVHWGREEAWQAQAGLVPSAQVAQAWLRSRS